jgi:hypothetical protein
MPCKALERVNSDVPNIIEYSLVDEYDGDFDLDQVVKHGD